MFQIRVELAASAYLGVREDVFAPRRIQLAGPNRQGDTSTLQKQAPCFHECRTELAVLIYTTRCRTDKIPGRSHHAYSDDTGSERCTLDSAPSVVEARDGVSALLPMTSQLSEFRKPDLARAPPCRS